MFLLVQPSSCRCWDMRVTKHPSTLLQGCISPLNVHQRQLWLRGWGCIGGNFIEDWGSFIFSLPWAIGVEAFVFFWLVLPSSLWAIWYHVAKHPQLLVLCFLYLWDRGFCVLESLWISVHIPSFQYSGCCPGGHGFPGLLSRGWFLFDAVSRFHADFGFSLDAGYSSVLCQGSDHYPGLTAPWRASLAVQDCQRHVNWLMGQQLFLLRI